MARFSPEDTELVKYFDAIRKIGLDDYIYHVANERRCSVQEGRNLKRKGVKKGVLDTFHMITTGRYPGMYIEFKDEGKSLTKEQKEFSESAIEQGYKVHVAYTSVQALNQLRDYLKNTVFESFVDRLPPACLGN